MKRTLLGLSGAALLILAAACGPKYDSQRWQEAEKASKNQPAVSKQAVKGEDLNQFFPKAEAPYSLTFKQEKAGFALAELEKNGKNVASMAISDTASEPAARDKFASSSLEVAGHPAALSGSLGTAVLVAGKYQVQVRSMNPGLTPKEREVWIAKFDLDGLSTLSGGAK